MSRRATPGQAAQNQQTIKSLLKLETNKICADCKRNKRQCPPPIPLMRAWYHGFGFTLYTNVSLHQIHDGRLGTWVFSSAFVALVFIEEWAHTSVESSPLILMHGPMNNSRVL
jgi:hypothetical protein